MARSEMQRPWARRRAWREQRGAGERVLEDQNRARVLSIGVTPDRAQRHLRVPVSVTVVVYTIEAHLGLRGADAGVYICVVLVVSGAVRIRPVVPALLGAGVGRGIGDLQ